jgi:N-acetylglucosamine-6-sulfatase
VRARALIALVSVPALAAGVVAGPAPVAAAGPAPVNVVVIMTDDQRLDDMSVMPKTQEMVGERGVAFRRSYATFPLCCPARVTFLTGQYAHNHGVTGNLAPEGIFDFMEESQTTSTVPYALQQAGYRTAFYGKYLNGYAVVAKQKDGTLYIPPGYDDWRAGTIVGKMFEWEQAVRGEPRLWGSDPADYQTDVLKRQSVHFIRTNLDKGVPFFLTISPLAAHKEGRRAAIDPRHNPRPAVRHRKVTDDFPLRKLPSFNEMDVEDKPNLVKGKDRLDAEAREQARRSQNDRLGSLLAVDDLVERVVATLREEGALRRTLVIFTSDNGYMLGEHRLFGKNTIYEESARVPLLMRGAGLPRGEVVRSLVGTVDLAPTIYDVTGVAPLLPQDGAALLDVVANPSSYAGRELLIETIRAAALRTGPYKYVEIGANQGGVPEEFELYDLRADPYELNSRHADPAYAAVRLQLAARLAALRDCTGNGCR